MQDFLRHIPVTNTNVSRSIVETLIKTRQEKLFTGVIYIKYSSDDAWLFTFLGGIQQKLYHLREQTMEADNSQSWKDMIDHPNTSVSILEFTEEALRSLRVACEAPILQMEQFSVPRDDLSDHVRKWSEEMTPTILYVSGERTEKLYLIAGNSAPVIEELSWTGEKARFSVCDASFPVHFPPADYRVKRYVSDGKHVIWQEYELRFAFGPLMRIMINRFSELAGRILAERLCEQISQYTRDDRMNITVSVNGVANRHYFNSIEDAAHIYLKILRKFREEAGTAIGVRMADGLARETLFKQDERRRKLLQRYIFDQYVLDYGQGMVWR